MKKCSAWLLLGTVLVGAVLLKSGAFGPRPDAPGPEEPTDPDREGPAFFEDVTARSAVDFTYRNGEDLVDAGGQPVLDAKGKQRTHLAILESLGGGLALLDYDGDGRLDLFLTGGGYYSGPPDYHHIEGHPCKLYKNLGGFRFRDVTRKAGLEALAGGAPWFYSHGAAVGDYDRDGWPDLLVTGWGRVALFRNVPADTADPSRGRCFLDVSEKAGLRQGITWATSAAFADLDGDGFADLYVCQYVNWSFANHPDCSYDGKGTPDICPPKKFEGLPGKLYRNNGNGTFTDVSAEAGLHRGGGHTSKALGVLVVDVNLDGRPDIYVANDTVANFLYVNHSSPGKIRLNEEGMLSGTALDGGGATNGSMGLAAGDPDGSGRPALWVTNYENELHALYLNRSTSDNVSFLFATPAVGIAAIGQKYVGWGTGFLDLDHHGWEDLFIANGHAIRYPEATGGGSTRRQRPVLLRNQGGKFKPITPRGGAYFERQHLARGAVLGDLDNDGRTDLVVTHTNEPVAILRNVADTSGNHWLGVELAGQGRADAVGARVILEAGGRKQTRFATGGGSYASSGDRRHVFGLGQTARIDRLTVVWPDGKQQQWTGLAPDRYYRLTQGEEKAALVSGEW